MGHDHHPSCHAPPTHFEKQFIIGITLNIAFIVVEVIYGFAANSLALLADAGHNAGDVLGLFMAWGAILLGKSKPSPRYTYGLRSSSILAALLNALILVGACFIIAWDAIYRLFNPQHVVSTTIIAVAFLGIIINGITAWLFMAGRKEDVNIEGAFLHMTADALVSLGVVVAGVLIFFTDWLWIDPVISLLIALLIIIGTWGMLKDSFNLALHGTPKHINIQEVKTYLASCHGVKNVHDLHVWAMSTRETALSVHLLMENGHPGDRFLIDLAHELEHHFQIGHSTIQIEIGDGPECKPCSR